MMLWIIVVFSHGSYIGLSQAYLTQIECVTAVEKKHHADEFNLDRKEWNFSYACDRIGSR